MGTVPGLPRVATLLETKYKTGVGFELGALRAFEQLQASVRSLIESTPGKTGRPSDLARTLRVHTKLAWQAHRIAHSSAPLSQAGIVPGPVAMERLLDAASRRGVPAETIDAVRAAHCEIESLIKLHARNRGEFETMVNALTDSGAEHIDSSQKRAAFKAQSHLLGVQANANLAFIVHQPSATNPNRLDVLAVRGLIGLRRFRRDATAIISQRRLPAIKDAGGKTARHEPLSPESHAEYGVSLLREFCSTPLPKLRRIPMSMRGMSSIEIVGDGIGNASEVTCVIGDCFRDANVRVRDEHNRHLVCNVRVRTPCEALVHDVLIHEDLKGFGSPSLRVLSDHRDVDVMLEYHIESREYDRLPLRETVTYLGKGPDVLETAEIPRYRELARSAVGRVGWDLDRFHVYRVHIEHPVMPSSVVVTLELPERMN